MMEGEMFAYSLINYFIIYCIKKKVQHLASIFIDTTMMIKCCGRPCNLFFPFFYKLISTYFNVMINDAR